MGSINRLDLYRRGRDSERERKSAADSGIEGKSLLETLGDETGGDVITRTGMSYLRIQEHIPRNHVHGAVSLQRSHRRHEGTLHTLFPQLVQSGKKKITLGDMLFFDIETTGLSGGAGTHLFLIGLLRVDHSGILFTQYFLHSLSSEGFYLEAIAKEFADCDKLVSYNGRSYDYNILKNRYIMAGIPFPGSEPIHLDLLYTSRRIWRGLFPDYTLSTVEKRVLQVERGEDIPGWQIPEIYADYLRGRGVVSDMIKMIRHNRNDVLSLLALLIRQIELVEGVVRGGAGKEVPFNPLTLSDMLLCSERMGDALSLLLEHNDSTEALKRLALLCKRNRQFDMALKHFEELRSRKLNLVDYIFACTETAKIYEHQLRDYCSAIACTEKMLRRVERAGHLRIGTDMERVDMRREILHRLNRLKRKQEKESR
jgi:uncharacterized protein YprB with RNaseH-like and TPR domain